MRYILFADRQPKPGAFGFAGLVDFHLLEAFEDFAELVCWDAGAGASLHLDVGIYA